ncbi:hypothetical protein F66182_15994 [Fusarium sp. NRRL 66182]|nr:hypothetical protein F66182_15994 [Fusarium sp. NRRL 66182]
MSSTTSIATSSTSAATSTSTGDSGGGGGPSSSPLLFFVALGFGVVFTNLWIIVGVKYCFRYNQRNRQLRNEETGEPIDLTAVPRTHRRRREKKLMSMEDVNERFPLMKYKAWRSSRADRGLPSEGGIAAPGNRPETPKAGESEHNPSATAQHVEAYAPKGHDRTDSVSRKKLRLLKFSQVVRLPMWLATYTPNMKKKCMMKMMIPFKELFQQNYCPVLVTLVQSV